MTRNALVRNLLIFRFTCKRKDCIVTDGNGNVIYVAHFQ